MSWFPIETAPKDGSTIMVAVKGAENPAFVFWSTKYQSWVEEAYEDLETAIEVCGVDWVLGYGDWPLTHWKSVPEMPQ